VTHNMPAVQPCCQQVSAVQRCKVLPARTSVIDAIFLMVSTCNDTRFTSCKFTIRGLLDLQNWRTRKRWASSTLCLNDRGILRVRLMPGKRSTYLSFPRPPHLWGYLLRHLSLAALHLDLQRLALPNFQGRNH
jgi:hypothetical protein